MQPFKCNEDDEIDGAAEGDVVERVEQLREDVGIELAFLGEWPAEHWNSSIRLSWGFWMNFQKKFLNPAKMQCRKCSTENETKEMSPR